MLIALARKGHMSARFDVHVKKQLVENESEKESAKVCKNFDDLRKLRVVFQPLDFRTNA